MKEWPKISIVTPSFNQGQFLEETILSVLNQDYPNLEYIIIDGGSTDNSVEIIKKYADRLAYWVSEPDKGQSDAINKGFRKSSGEILAWINSDDVYYSGVLAKMAQYFVDHPEVDFIFGYHDDIDETGKILRRGTHFPYVAHAFRRGFAQICQPTSFWRRSVWDSCGPLDENRHYLMDLDYFLGVVESDFQVRAVPVRVCAFRYHSHSKAVAGVRESKRAYWEILGMHYPELHCWLTRYVAWLEVTFLRGIRRIKRQLPSLGKRAENQPEAVRER